jgi:hypothetical protein
LTSTIITRTVVCDLGLRHDRCSGIIRSIAQGDSPCECDCHGQLPDEEEELALAADAIAEMAIERDLEARHFGAML